MAYIFETTCVSARGIDIQNMEDVSREISLRTFRKYVDTTEFERDMGYVRHGKGLRLASDYHVRYYKAKYRGRPCVHIDHSSINYIWVKRDA